MNRYSSLALTHSSCRSSHDWAALGWGGPAQPAQLFITIRWVAQGVKFFQSPTTQHDCSLVTERLKAPVTMVVTKSTVSWMAEWTLVTHMTASLTSLSQQASLTHTYTSKGQAWQGHVHNSIIRAESSTAWIFQHLLHHLKEIMTILAKRLNVINVTAESGGCRVLCSYRGFIWENIEGQRLLFCFG